MEPDIADVDAYCVERGQGRCPHCGSPGNWDIIGPDGIWIGSYSDETQAHEEANALNAAFNAGRSYERQGIQSDRARPLP